ncbi:villin-3 isoform X1 [Arabidopsis lyrata subsp. lyrata]|uniref:villin-3 isoform X1 n=2 Tax=Arabidopsis lyrata subsp. lyrata TaxID=81972 RepID=UPI000A29A43B|nr:villin-3 isoform X1 [Arabidopsis lyrata subsp. lyrata]XP_020878377.1 villin-3 isoform X1 [Arabidopsis lyrata subsp. lyrata]|eukprot:XP_020878376.1 villin-3 isoform X1 [Arabidopsis lyrata subsp. lyrata]
MKNSLKGRPVQARIFGGKEPPQFVAVFQHMVVLKGGLSSGYKNRMTEKGSSDKTYKMESIEMEVTIIVSLGILSVKNAKEGTESLSFWFSLALLFLQQRLKRFTTFDLLTEEMHLLMLKFIGVGQCVDPKEKQTAFEISQFCAGYIFLAGSLNGLSPKVPLYEITEGNEPCFLTTYFSWYSTKATVQGNSFQKKAALLLGTHHVLEILQDQSRSGNQGPRQRAAALTSAYYSSSGKEALQ